jgi:asparagine synthetase B (glutamine-hydrolysing)
MKNLLYYSPYKFLNSDRSKHLTEVQRSFYGMFNPWISLSDRTGTLDLGEHVFNNSPIPEKKTANSFESCSVSRITEIIKSFQNNKNKEKLVIMYSGGIDSTLIVCLLISSPYWNDIKDNVLLAFNEDSQVENPKFFRDVILPQFGHCLISSNNFYEIASNPCYSVVTGECADNLFGSLTVKSYMDSTGNFDCLHDEWESGCLDWLLDKVKDNRDEREQMLYDLVNASPIDIVSNHDFLWWINYTMKWQAVKYRMSMHAPNTEQAVAMASNVINFFDTVQFQEWALYTDEKKVGDTWASYKLPAKQLINDVWNNKQYLIYKTKWPSLPTITRYNTAWGYLWEEDNTLTVTKD